jgi:hypothetical protein
MQYDIIYICNTIKENQKELHKVKEKVAKEVQ